MKKILCYFVFSRPQTKMLFSDRASKILCHHKNRGHKPLSRVLFSLRSIFTICSPTPGKLFYLISDKTLLNQNHFLLLSNCYITRVPRQGEGKGEFVAASEKNSICLIV